MPQFECEGIDRSGHELKQRVDAPDPHAARDQLRSRGIFCTSIKQIESAVSSPVSQSIPTSAPRDAAHLDEQLLALLRENRKIEAVKVYREATKCDLRTAKTYVESLPKRSSGPRLGTTTHPSTSTFTQPAHEGLDLQVLTLLRANQMIQAVKVYRDAKKCDLRTAKAHVDAIAEQHGIKTSGCGIRAAVLLLAVTFVVAASVVAMAG